MLERWEIFKRISLEACQLAGELHAALAACWSCCMLYCVSAACASASICANAAASASASAACASAAALLQVLGPCTCTCSAAAALHLQCLAMHMHCCSSLAVHMLLQQPCEWAADCAALCCCSSMQWLMIQTEFLARVASTHPPTLYSQLYHLDKYILQFRQIQFAIRINTFCASTHNTQPAHTLLSALHCLQPNALARPQRRAFERGVGWRSATDWRMYNRGGHSAKCILHTRQAVHWKACSAAAAAA